MVKKFLISLIFLLGLVAVVPLTHAQTGDNPPPTILSFSSDLNSIKPADAEAGTTSMTLSWQTVGMTPDQHLVLQWYQVNAWQDIDGDSADTPLPETGTYEVDLLPSQTFSPPMIRLLIVANEREEDGDTIILDERVITISYDIPELPLAPVIESFTTTQTGLDINDLAQGRAEVPVSWEVTNRLPLMNLVFEQVMDGEQVVNVELPRPNLWVPSSGIGTLVPQMPPSGDTVHLRLRLVDVETGNTLQKLDLPLPITGTLQEPPTPAPLLPPPTVPPVSAQPVLTPQLMVFTASPNPYTPGQPITLRWAVNYATSVRVVQRSWYGNEIVKTISSGEPPAGMLEYTPEMPYVYHYSDFLVYMVIPTNTAGQEVLDWTMFITVPLVCPYTYFFGTVPDSCPSTALPEQAPASFQSFERGMMVWSGGVIWVLYNDGTWQQVTDVWTEGTPIPDVGQMPPAGLLQPIRGFGYQWAINQSVRDRIGWATSAEQSYTWMRQYVALRGPTTKDALDFYISLPDARAVFMDSLDVGNLYGVWAYVN